MSQSAKICIAAYGNLSSSVTVAVEFDNDVADTHVKYAAVIIDNDAEVAVVNVVNAPAVAAALSGNTFRVDYQLSIRHTLGTVLEAHQSSENTYRYFYIIQNKNMYSLSYASQYYCLLVVFVRLKTFVDF